LRIKKHDDYEEIILQNKIISDILNPAWHWDLLCSTQNGKLLLQMVRE
jgi:hypothetical protein